LGGAQLNLRRPTAAIHNAPSTDLKEPAPMLMSNPRRRTRTALSIALVALGLLTLAPTALARHVSPTGMFVIGDTSASTQSTVLFWGAKWWKRNQLSGGTAPASFKGFANSVDPTTAQCGDTWTTRPGNSSFPPLTVSGDVPMIVSTHITKSGPIISGDINEIVLVHVNPGYGPNPGHPGTGTIVGVVCSPGGGPTPT
jgi:hypothetical protein